MRKRRRLADKLTIMVCAVLVAVSAFFYAPIHVSASSNSDVVLNGSSSSGYAPGYRSTRFTVATDSHDFGSYSSEYVSVNADLSYTFTETIGYAIFGYSVVLYCDDFAYCLFSAETINSAMEVYSYSDSFNVDFVCKSSQLDNVYLKIVGGGISGESVSTNYYTLNCTFNSFDVTPLSSSDGDAYQNGYNAGFTAGEQSGYGNGYSQGFTDGEASVDTDAIYDEAFQAGKDSVDTQSYYDAGYQAGYQVAYSEGYESGYDEGYQSAMDRIDSWGADSTDYPVLVFNKSLVNVKCLMEVETNMPSVGYGQADLCNLDIDINPSHTYKIVFDSGYRSTSVNNFSGSQNEQFNYNIGLYSFPYSYGESFCFVQGSSLSSVFRLEIFDYSSHFYEIGGNNDVFKPWSASRLYNFESIDIYVYDYGPSGETQNHIANQTDSLTNGFNDSQGNSVNNEFSSGLNDFETAEDSLFATATTGMKDFTFFDISSVPAMVTGMSFVGSIMSGWFTQAGGASGVGIVLSILFSIMLVAMVLGLYRWYQSKGGKD